MYIAYFDESGDDGIYDPNLPNSSKSKYFIYSNFYLPKEHWKTTYNNFKNFRKDLYQSDQVNFINIEFHTREFLQARDPYFSLFGNKIINPSFRRKIILAFCEHIGKMQYTKIITTVIPKQKINQTGGENYCIEYSIRENLTRMWLDIGKSSNFLVIADRGREAVVQKYCRKLQVHNFVNGHDNKLESMIEDCLFKDSKESYFLQIADLVAYLSYLWITPKNEWAKSVQKVVNEAFLEECFSLLRPVLNTKSTRDNNKAIVIYPK